MEPSELVRWRWSHEWNSLRENLNGSGMTWPEMARLTGCSESTLRRFGTGSGRLSAKTIDRLEKWEAWDPLEPIAGLIVFRIQGKSLTMEISPDSYIGPFREFSFRHPAMGIRRFVVQEIEHSFPGSGASEQQTVTAIGLD